MWAMLQVHSGMLAVSSAQTMSAAPCSAVEGGADSHGRLLCCSCAPEIYVGQRILYVQSMSSALTEGDACSTVQSLQYATRHTRATTDSETNVTTFDLQHRQFRH